MTNPTLPVALGQEAPSGELQGVPEEQIFDLVYRQMRSLVGGRERDFDDLVQDAMEQALRSLSAFEGRSKLSTWTYQVCYRTMLKRRRWYGRWLKRFTLTHSGELPEEVTQHEQPSQRLERGEEKRRLSQAMAKLSAKKRVVVALHDMEGLASEEISEIIGVKLGTVRSRLRDGRKELLALLAEDPYFGERVIS